MGRRTLVVATRNEHKLRELGEIVTGVELEPLSPNVKLPPEDGASIADDSGIEARALGGAPGVRSARFAGPEATEEQNLSKLLRELDRSDDRAVAYVCVIAHVDEDGDEALFEGRCEGTLAREPRGSRGFGYDPAFVPDDTGPDDDRTMAELSAEEKHAISHRGRAARRLSEYLSRRTGE
jgi:XTP/dITP diphosphohydrolase